MADCCLIKKVATVEVYENKNEVRAYGFMAGDRNTPVMEVRFKHLWGESNLSSCKLRWIIVDDVGSLLVGEVPIQSDNTALINLPNELFTGDRRMKVQLTVASCDGERILNLQQFTDLKVINSLAPNEVVEPVYQILINQLYDETQKYLSQLDTLYTSQYGSLENLYVGARASLEQYLINAENGGNAEFLQGYNPKNFNRVENTINELVNSAGSKYKVGDVVEVLGYYTAGDGAHHKRIAKAEDDGSGELGQNGIWWCIVHSGEVNVSWFGAKGDGVTDDTTEIQKALDFCEKVTSSKSKTFVVGDIAINKNDSELHNLNFVKTAGANWCLIVKAKNVIIHNCIFKSVLGTGQPYSEIRLLEGADFATIRNNIFKGSIYSAVICALEGERYVNPVKGLTVVENEFTGYARPLFFHSSENMIISKNHIHDVRFDAIRLRDTTGQVIISDNHFKNIGSPDWADTQTRDAVDSYWGGFELIISNNIMDTIACQGLDLKRDETGNNDAKKLIITGNMIKKCRYSGIKISGKGVGESGNCSEVIIADNIVQECGQDSVNTAYLHGAVFVNYKVDNVIVKANNISFNLCRGLQFLKGEGESLNVIVSSNIICNNGNSKSSSSRFGITTEGVTNLILSENIVMNDTSKDNAIQEVGFNISSTVEKSTTVVNNISKGHSVADYYHSPQGGRLLHCKTFFGNNFENLSRPFGMEFLEMYGSENPTSADGSIQEGMLLKNSNTELGSYYARRRINGAWHPVGQQGFYIHEGSTPVGSYDAKFKGQIIITSTKNIFMAVADSGNTSNSWRLIGSSATTLSELDTPYYTLKMQQEGIYTDYVAYRDELCEYENSQTTDETMLLPVLHEPVIPESVKQFAEKYKLI